MLKNKVPKRLWDYGFIWICETESLSVSSLRYASGRTTLDYIIGDNPNISEYLDFTFYYCITYLTNAGLGERSIDKWLGVYLLVGQMVSYLVLMVSMHFISCVAAQRSFNP